MDCQTPTTTTASTCTAITHTQLPRRRCLLRLLVAAAFFFLLAASSVGVVAAPKSGKSFAEAVKQDRGASPVPQDANAPVPAVPGPDKPAPAGPAPAVPGPAAPAPAAPPPAPLSFAEIASKNTEPGTTSSPQTGTVVPAVSTRIPSISDTRQVVTDGGHTWIFHRKRHSTNHVSQGRDSSKYSMVA
ncbi:hypothetical protein DFJ73DRAFT_115148 [Zopfochytrium polystomum]|nr:hypothetical protein DFJ73DRAFT_115148 [Zopfochytrium polystomum]